ncbi:MAG: type IV pilus secretin PilQ, partial [Arenicella sp.]|nr:type IV pilus secretin PilQ [Arenicella sp.]
MNDNDSGSNTMRAIKLPRRFKKLCVSVLMLALAGVNTAYAQSANLTDVVFSKLSGGDVQINFLADAQLAEPGTFSTDRPARIAIDFFGMKSLLANPKTEIGMGKVDSIIAVQTSDRTRIIVNLLDTARYKLLPIDKGYSLTVYNTASDESQVTVPKPFATRPDIESSTSVTNIDFRRSEAGGGKLIIDLSNDNATIDTRERDGEIIIDLLDVNVPAALEQRLDVTDFATPVQTIDSFQNASNVRMSIVPTGKYQHLSFQSGRRFTLIVDPIIETEEEISDKLNADLGFNGERLSINFQKIDVRSALAVIADFTGINFVTSDSVQGEITINLRDVPWDQALDVILRTKGLAKRQTGNVVWVAPSSEIQKVEEEELKALAIVEEFAPLSTEIIQINYAKAADIAAVVKSVKVVKQGNVSSSAGLGTTNSSSLNVTETDKNSLLSARGSVTVDERTNSLLVQDVPEKIKQLRNVIAKLDKPVRQVLIETRIVEANDNFSRELGARLGFQRVTQNVLFPGSNDSVIGDVISGGSLSGNTTLSDSVNAQAADPTSPLVFDRSGGLAVDLGASDIGSTRPASYAFDIFRTGRGFAHLISLELSALEADGRGRVVASPRLITSNQKEAVISQGQSIYITVPGSGTGDEGGGVEEIQVELRLTVTPQITPDDRVIMDVDITQDNVISLSAAVNVVGTKEIRTQILADNGETVVIGGIYQQDENEGENKVPFLGDIPFLGNLFKQKSKRSNRTELLIFLTPKIITPKLN